MPRSGSSERLVLDTSAYSRFRARHDGAMDHIARAAGIIVPAVVIGELEAAFRLGSRERENRQTLAEFLDEPFVTVMAVTSDVAREYGAIFATLRRNGTPLPLNDIWIAACARVVNAVLLTFDRDFEKVPDLRCALLASTEG